MSDTKIRVFSSLGAGVRVEAIPPFTIKLPSNFSQVTVSAPGAITVDTPVRNPGEFVWGIRAHHCSWSAVSGAEVREKDTALHLSNIYAGPNSSVQLLSGDDRIVENPGVNGQYGVYAEPSASGIHW